MRCRSSNGFTLVELLVVMSIVALLMGVLLPALSRSRESARTSACLSNLGQISRATTMYQDEGEDYMPVALPYNGGYLSNFNHGGRYPVAGAAFAYHNYCVFPFDRPLNKYVHPELPLGGKEWNGNNGTWGDWRQRMDRGLNVGDFQNPKRFDFPVFECPSDRAYGFNYQETSGELGYGRSCYQAIGSSYLFNCYWYYSLTGHRHRSPSWSWVRGVRMYQRARLLYPSQMVAYFDDPTDATFWRRHTPAKTHHGSQDVNSWCFLDGRAAQVKTEYDGNTGVPQYNTSSYFLVFPEYLQR